MCSFFSYTKKVTQKIAFNVIRSVHKLNCCCSNCLLLHASLIFFCCCWNPLATNVYIFCESPLRLSQFTTVELNFVSKYFKLCATGTYQNNESTHGESKTSQNYEKERKKKETQFSIGLVVTQRAHVLRIVDFPPNCSCIIVNECFRLFITSTQKLSNLSVLPAIIKHIVINQKESLQNSQVSSLSRMHELSTYQTYKRTLYLKTL